MKLIKEIINPRQRVLVLNGDFVQFSVIKHNLLPPSFLFANNTGAPQGEVLGLIRPFPEYSSSCSFNIVNSVGAIRYGALEMGVAPGIMLIENSTTLSRESPDIYSNTSKKISTHIHPGIHSALTSSSSYLQQWDNQLILLPEGLALSDELKLWLV